MSAFQLIHLIYLITAITILPKHSSEGKFLHKIGKKCMNCIGAFSRAKKSWDRGAEKVAD